jgi:GNAT superfamily N-acetyltransferase
MRRLPPDWARLLANVNCVRPLALVATVDLGPAADIVAVARYEPTSDPAIVEVAFVVVDGWQNRGLGTIRFRLLMDAARARGVARFRAWVLADNTWMLDLIARVPDGRERKLERGVVELVFSDGRAARASRG